MYDMQELEKKWRKYRRNKIKKPIIIGTLSTIILVGIGIVATTYYTSSNNRQEVVINKKSNTVQASKVNKPAIVITKVDANGNSNPTPVATSTQNGNALLNVKQSTNNNVEDNGIDLSKATIIKPNVPDDEIRVIGFDDKKEKNSIKKEYSDILVPKKTTEDIEAREEVADLEEKFKETQDPNDSLAIARYYYKKGNYKKAETWAVNTNNIDGDLEDSWLIFAKSRAKQGFRTDAIKVLQTFYDESNSIKAKKLLDKLRRGESY